MTAHAQWCGSQATAVWPYGRSNARLKADRRNRYKEWNGWGEPARKLSCNCPQNPLAKHLRKLKARAA